MTWGEALGWLGAVLYIARLLPQPWHTWRSGQVDGVSVQALCNGVVSGLGWLVYGLAAGLPPVWVSVAIAIPIDLLAIGLLRRRLVMRHVVVAAVWGGIMAVGWVLGGALGLGAVLAVSVVVNHAPQAVAALRGRDLRGLHPGTWWLALADAALWGGYGAIDGDPALVAYGVVLSTVGVIVLVRMLQTAGTDAMVAVPAEP